MFRKKLMTLPAVLAAVSLMTALPAAAAGDRIDVSSPDSTLDIRVNKPYLNFDVSAGEDVDISDMKLSIVNSKGEKIAYFKPGDSKLTINYNVKGNHLYDFTKFHCKEDMEKASYNYNDYVNMYDVFKPDKMKGRAPSGEIFNYRKGACVVNSQDDTGSDGIDNYDYLIGLTDDYYYRYTDREKMNIIDTMTIPANTIFVETSSRYKLTKDKNTFFYLKPSSSPDLVSDYNKRNKFQVYEHAGKSTVFNASAGKYTVCVNGTDPNSAKCEAFDHDTRYFKIKIPFNEAFPGLADDELMIERDFFGTKYTFDLRGDQSTNTFSAVCYSGAAITASAPDAMGDIEIWVSEDSLTSYMAYDFKITGGGGGGSVRTASLPKSLEKINTLFEFPQGGFCAYNLEPGVYSFRFEDAANARDYNIEGGTIQIKDTKYMQKTSLFIEKKPMLLGDCNRDGIINITDVALAAMHVKGIKSIEGAAAMTADVDRNGSINITDLMIIASHAKKIKLLPETYI